jgi:hypothetical protein
MGRVAARVAAAVAALAAAGATGFVTVGPAVADPPTVPDAPSITQLTTSPGTATVGISAGASDGGDSITSFGVECTSSDFGAAANASGATPPIEVGVLTGGATYTCTATATNGVGTSEKSAPWGPFLAQVIPPPSPTGAISGTVTTDTATPLTGYCAEATEPWGNWSLASAPIAVDGTYTIGGLSTHTYAVRFVDCTGGGDWLPEWYAGVPVSPWGSASQDGATNVDVVDGATTTGIDGVLSPGAHVRGTITDTNGAPLEHVCAGALGQYDPVAVTRSAADGTYDLLAPEGTRVVGFFDCWGGNLVTQFWEHTPNQVEATPLVLAIGAPVEGIDAAMVEGGRIRGEVTDAVSGDPLQDVCVNVSSGAWHAGTRTQSDGHYDVGTLPPATYAVSFVDCSPNPTHGGTVRPGVVVDAGQDTTVDVALAVEAPGSIAGHLTTSFGTPLEGACVAVLSGFDGEPRFAGPTGPDGRYEIDGIGTGSYFVGFFGCDGDNPGKPMPDPLHPGVTYHPQWYANAFLGVQPDPWADGATPVTVTSGAQTIVDNCFDECTDTIWITGATAGDGSVSLDFLSTVPGAPDSDALSAQGVGAAAADGAPDYDATCTSPDGGAASEASGATSPIVVTGLTNGATYTCVVSTVVGDTVYTSHASAAFVPEGAAAPVAPAAPAIAAPPLALTGASGSRPLATVGVALVLLGLLALFAGRRSGRAASHLG